FYSPMSVCNTTTKIGHSQVFFGIPLLVLRFAWRNQSVVLVTEGLGKQKSHDRIVLRVSERGRNNHGVRR
ncbi:MAG: hypothetical protein ACRD1I_07325, partial [Terriglobia bacterium]